MPDDRDPLLQTLFDQAQHDLDGEVFTALVMTQTRKLRYRIVAGLVCFALMLAACAWFLAIPLQVAQLITQVLTITLIDPGDTWLAWLISPVNNIASLLVLSVKAIRVMREKTIGVFYATHPAFNR